MFQEQTGLDLHQVELKDPKVRSAVQALTTACEGVKKELSEAAEALLDLPSFYQGHHLEIRIDRRTFEGLIEDKVYGTKALVLKTIEEACLEVDDIDRLILVGGSTKIPLVSRMLTESVKEPYVADNVDLVVSAGAAIMAANLYAVQEGGTARADYAPTEVDYAPVEIKVTDVVAHPVSMGFLCIDLRLASDEVRAGHEDSRYCKVVIAKNSRLPSSTKFVTRSSDPSVGAAISSLYRGAEISPSRNEFLGKLIIRYKPTGEDVYFVEEIMLNEDGILEYETAIIDDRRSNVIDVWSRGIVMEACYELLEPKPIPIKSKVSTTIDVSNR
jgi:molecular chaperone DnaK (HSP70)